MIRISPEHVRAVLLADEAIAWAKITSHMEIQRMNDSRKKLDYIDLHPEPVEQEEITDLAFWLYVALTFVVGCALLVITMGWAP